MKHKINIALVCAACAFVSTALCGCFSSPGNYNLTIGYEKIQYNTDAASCTNQTAVGYGLSVQHYEANDSTQSSVSNSVPLTLDIPVTKAETETK